MPFSPHSAEIALRAHGTVRRSVGVKFPQPEITRPPLRSRPFSIACAAGRRFPSRTEIPEARQLLRVTAPHFYWPHAQSWRAQNRAIRFRSTIRRKGHMIPRDSMLLREARNPWYRADRVREQFL